MSEVVCSCSSCNKKRLAACLCPLVTAGLRHLNVAEFLYLERIIRNDADPTTNLQVMTDIIGKLYLSIYTNMATRDLFANVNKARDEINSFSLIR